MSQFLDNLLSRTSQPTLSAAVRFTARRHALLAENVANATTPGYRQKDLSQKAFDAALAGQIDRRRAGRPADVAGVVPGADPITGGVLYHDRNNRSMEELMTESAKNALRHNALTELMRKQFDQLGTALRERV